MCGGRGSLQQQLQVTDGQRRHSLFTTWEAHDRFSERTHALLLQVYLRRHHIGCAKSAYFKETVVHGHYVGSVYTRYMAIVETPTRCTLLSSQSRGCRSHTNCCDADIDILKLTTTVKVRATFSLSRIAKFLGTRRLSYFPLQLQNEYFFVVNKQPNARNEFATSCRLTALIFLSVLRPPSSSPSSSCRTALLDPQEF